MVRPVGFGTTISLVSSLLRFKAQLDARHRCCCSCCCLGTPYDHMTGAFCGALGGFDGFFKPPISGPNMNSILLQSQSLMQRGNVVVDVAVDIYYDALEYDEEDADSMAIDVGMSPLFVRGGDRQLPNSTSPPLSDDVLVGIPAKLPAYPDQPPPPPYTPEYPPPPPKQDNAYRSLEPPPPPQELPLRFLRAGKNDPIEGRRRYEQTLAWRKEYGMDQIIKSPHPYFELIKQHYPQFFHLRGRNNEPVWYERPLASI
ncbi:Sec14p-like protein [Fragilaria crotonensis]|nr:Sec14p-like protein [Fragilaria crotonensis]